VAGVEVQGVTKNFGETRVLKGVDLSVRHGEFISLVGPSGCGKSTLLRIIAGLETPTSGDIRIGGSSVAHVRGADRNLSMVFQSYALYPHLTVAENIAVPLRMRKLNRWQRLPLVGPFMPGSASVNEQIADAVKKAGEALEIDHLLSRKPGQLSGGQRQRVALGRAIVREPSAFLLDEPLSNLDAKLRVQTRAEIAQLHRRLGATFIYVTHDQVEAMTMSDRIAVMMDGDILQYASPATIYNDPEDLRVAEFIGSPKINVLPAHSRSDGRVLLQDKPLALTAPSDMQLQLALRPEAIRLSPRKPLLEGVVSHVENLGSDVFVQVKVDGLMSPLVARVDPAKLSGLSLGSTIKMGFDAADALLFDAEGKRMRDNVSATKSSDTSLQAAE
jgi:multiple sugar transport system ATP-binding protein